MLSTERRRHDVHLLFGDIIYDVINAHWRVNNKIKKKIYSFSVDTIKNSISCNENIQIFTRASHSWKYGCFHYTLWQYLWYSQQKSKYPLFILLLAVKSVYILWKYKWYQSLMNWYRIISLVSDMIYIFTPRFGRLLFSSLFQMWMLPPLQIFEHL